MGTRLTIESSPPEAVIEKCPRYMRVPQDVVKRR